MDSFDDDFMMSNIVMGNKPKTSTLVKKADLKKEKYTQKIKQQRRRSAGKPVSYTGNQIINSINQTLGQNKTKMIDNSTPRRSSNNKEKKQRQNSKPATEQTVTEQPEGVQNTQNPSTQNKKPRMEVNSSRSSRQQRYKKISLQRGPRKVGTIDIKSSKAKMQQINEILPQQDLSLIQKLDKAPIEQLHLNKHLYDSLMQNDITKLTQIQTLSYASVYKRKDCIIKAATGSGKTLAYLIPLVNQLIELKHCSQREDGTTILVVCPTRELCIQAQKQAMRCLKRLPFVVTGCLVGGQQTNHEKSRIRKGIPLLFSTPGRLLYHLQNTQSFKLQNVKSVVFEQADRTLDMGFHNTLSEILQLMQKKVDLYKMQKILVSAHFNQKVQGLIKNLDMGSPQYIGFGEKKSVDKVDQVGQLGDSQQVMQIQPEDNHTTFEPRHQQQINTSSNLKQQYVLIAEEQKIPFTLSYITVLPNSKIMIFVSTIAQVQYIDYLLNNINYRNSNGDMTEERIQKRKVYKIHGDLDQKLRTTTYFDFRKEKYGIMISTQVAARGLDFPDLSHIVLFDVPPTIADYGNRIGRSGRFNSAGVSLLLLHYQQSDYAETIRYYNKDKPLQNIDKDIIYDNFQQYLKKLNIRDTPLHYIEGIVRSMVKDDDEKYNLARKAYVSMLRAYARLKEKHVFHVKKLNLKLLSRSFGLNSAQAEARYNPNAKQSHFEALRKKRKVESVRSLQVSEYL